MNRCTDLDFPNGPFGLKTFNTIQKSHKSDLKNDVLNAIDVCFLCVSLHFSIMKRSSSTRRPVILRTIRVKVGTHLQIFSLETEKLVDRKNAIEQVTKLANLAKAIVQTTASLSVPTPAVRQNESAYDESPFALPEFGRSADFLAGDKGVTLFNSPEEHDWDLHIFDSTMPDMNDGMELDGLRKSLLNSRTR